MSLEPLLTAPLITQMHVIAALIAVVLGPLVLLRRSRDSWHKRLGYVWVVAMGLTALTTFGMWAEIGPGPISPIHALSVFTLWALWKGVRAARARNIATHQKEMRSLYFWAMGIAGLFTFLPGRRMNIAVFGEPSLAGFALMAGLIGVGLAWYAYLAQRAVSRV